MNIVKEVRKATKRIKRYVRETPLEFSPYLSRITDSRVYLKLENVQVTNSFKVRGAFNKLLSLKSRSIHSEVFAASTGNHGLAVAYALDKLKLKGTIYLPTTVQENKIEALKEYNVNIEFYGEDCLQTELYAKNRAKNEKIVYISPYNDIEVIAGQGTVAQEIEQQIDIDNVDSVLVPVGGGGLISGVAGFLKERKKARNITIYGCQPQNSPVMSESIKAAKIVSYESKPTISDASAGGIETDSITFDFCSKYVDDFFVVSEEEIEKAIEILYEKHFTIAEGAGALPIAALLQNKEKFRKKTVILIISGGKLSKETLKKIICKK